ncbi:mechanosensitive ion channel family protein [Pleionea litopenaei]|uniref:Small-conductance mechanosensitive channel n=1 Tax=Pleionea litopenaei TaxID=3070815 RepID=A0AA51RTI8_9GAMM|nr:mechanosensitive ion channel domain-containing protein [Pleionea sp. HL-JVS1]WMS87209.1 mechanosensitive ion channel [Pleionea sp. HL-JVS1]
MTQFVQGMVDVAITWVQQNYLSVVMALLVFFIGKWIANLITKAVRTILTKAKVDPILVDFLSGIVKTVLILFVVVAALTQLGVATTSLVALIGAAGLAVGLALKDSLQNFASGVMLIMFKPFKAGDFVEAAGVTGVVEKIAIFSTIMRTGDNKEIIVPNGAIYGGTITNFSARPTRRVDMVFGIGYGDDIKKTKEVLARILAEDERILKDPAPVIAVSELGDSSVNFIVRPWVNSADYWNVYWDTHEKVKLTFDEEGISIPFPQMDVHLDKSDS